MHKILERQLRKYFGSGVPSGLKDFLDAVSYTYIHFDEDRALMERSLELNSKEMGEANRSLQNEIQIVKARTEELERFQKVTVGRELRMVELKNRIRELEKELGKA